MTVFPPVWPHRVGLGRSPRLVGRRSLLVASLCGMAIASCGAAPQSAMFQEAAPPENAQTASAPMAAADSADSATGQTAPTPPAAQPQLIKTAQLSLTVDDMEPAIAQTETILQRNQGYTLNLNDTEPSGARIVTLELRVPQPQLEPALADLTTLGRLQGRSINAQDVSDQLVDLDARLRNLRRTEASLLALLERSGSIKDILAVNQEITQVRQQIEQLDAQQKSLRDRVAYSTIHLTLTQNAATLGDPTPAALVQLQRTWTESTRSLRDLTVDLLQLGLWLLIYTPYWVLLGAGVWAGRRWWRSRRSRTPAAHPSSEQNN